MQIYIKIAATGPGGIHKTNKFQGLYSSNIIRPHLSTLSMQPIQLCT